MKKLEISGIMKMMWVKKLGESVSSPFCQCRLPRVLWKRAAYLCGDSSVDGLVGLNGWVCGLGGMGPVVLFCFLSYLYSICSSSIYIISSNLPTQHTHTDTQTHTDTHTPSTQTNPLTVYASTKPSKTQSYPQHPTPPSSPAPTSPNPPQHDPTPAAPAR
jgi:hypothetical protein